MVILEQTTKNSAHKVDYQPCLFLKINNLLKSIIPNRLSVGTHQSLFIYRRKKSNLFRFYIYPQIFYLLAYLMGFGGSVVSA